MSSLHEVLVELFQSRPVLAVELLAESFQYQVPAHESVECAPELYEGAPAEFRADVAVVLRAKQNQPVLGVAVDVQLHIDQDKQRTWPAAHSIVMGRLQCASVLLVVSPSAAVARWCATPIHLGHPGYTLTPLVLGPDQVPAVTDPDLAREHPERAMLSAIMHSEHPERDQIFRSLLTALDNHDDGTRYADLVLTALPTAARAHLEAFMATGTRITTMTRYHNTAPG
jgi:hypothetical protein